MKSTQNIYPNKAVITCMLEDGTEHFEITLHSRFGRTMVAQVKDYLKFWMNGDFYGDHIKDRPLAPVVRNNFGHTGHGYTYIPFHRIKTINVVYWSDGGITDDNIPEDSIKYHPPTKKPW